MKLEKNNRSKKEFEFSFTLNKFQILIILFILISFTSIFYVYAQRNASHLASEIFITDSSDVDRNLQEAVNLKKLGTSGTSGTNGQARTNACRLCTAGWGAQDQAKCDSLESPNGADDWSFYGGAVTIFPTEPSGIWPCSVQWDPNSCEDNGNPRPCTGGSKTFGTEGWWCYDWRPGGSWWWSSPWSINCDQSCTDEACMACYLDGSTLVDPHGCCEIVDEGYAGHADKHCNSWYWDGDNNQGYPWSIFEDYYVHPEGNGNFFNHDWPYIANLCCKDNRPV